METAVNGERVTIDIEIDRKLLVKLDAFEKRTQVSRPALLAGLVSLGFGQFRVTRAIFGDKLAAGVLRLLARCR